MRVTDSRSKMSKPSAAIFVVLLMLCLVMALPVSASHSTEIRTVVPDTHTVSVTVTNGGAVIADGKVYAEDAALQVPHGQPATLAVRPDAGYRTESVLLDGKPASLKGGILTLERVESGHTVKVSFSKDSTPPPSKEVYTVVGTLTYGGTPLAGAVLELRSNRPITVKTDHNGKFRFDGVEPGGHSLTVLKDGMVQGFIAFSIQPGTEEVEVLYASDGSITVTVEQDTKILRLDFNLTGTGGIVIEDAGKIDPEDTGAIEEYPPQTGDNSNMLIWVALLFVSGGALTVFGIKSRKRKAVR